MGIEFLSLILYQCVGHPADNHFMGALGDLIGWVAGLVAGVTHGGGFTVMVTVIYVVVKNQKKR